MTRLHLIFFLPLGTAPHRFFFSHTSLHPPMIPSLYIPSPLSSHHQYSDRCRLPLPYPLDWQRPGGERRRHGPRTHISRLLSRLTCSFCFCSCPDPYYVSTSCCCTFTCLYMSSIYSPCLTLSLGFLRQSTLMFTTYFATCWFAFWL